MLHGAFGWFNLLRLCRSPLRLLSQQLKFMHTSHQFLLLSSPPAKEARFRTAKKLYGSTFAFQWVRLVYPGVVTILVVIQKLPLNPGSKYLKSSRQTFWEIILFFFFFFFMLHLRYCINRSCPSCCRLNIKRVIAHKSSTVTEMHA